MTGTAFRKRFSCQEPLHCPRADAHVLCDGYLLPSSLVQLVDLFIAFQACGTSAGALLLFTPGGRSLGHIGHLNGQWFCSGGCPPAQPACIVAQALLQGIAQILHQVPTIGDLDGLGRTRRGSPGVILGSVTGDDLDELSAFYRDSYPSNWFDPRMVETGQYFGLREDDKLVSVAGVHVYAPTQRVAALGNIATDPAYRGRGLAFRCVARLCGNLLESVDAIGLNVKADNLGAIRLYERLGFERVAQYEEWSFSR